MAKNNCIMYPTAENGEDSKLYKGLLSIRGIDRPLANYIYSMYLLPGVAEDMDNAGLKRNAQNQHSAQKVFDYFNVTQLLNDIGSSNVDEVARTYHAKDAHLADILYDNSEDAIRIASDINEHNQNVVAYVTQTKNASNETKFVVKVVGKDANTLHWSSDVEVQRQAWNILTDVLRNKGIDVTSTLFDPQYLNVTNVEGFLESLKNTRATDPVYYNILEKHNIYMLIGMNEGSPRIQELKNRLGISSASNEELAKLVYDILKNNGGIASSYTAGQHGFIRSSLKQFTDYVGTSGTKLTDSEIQQMLNDIADVKDTVEQTKDSQVNQIIKGLIEEYPELGKRQINLGKDSHKNIDTYEKAVAHAIVSIKTQMRDILRKEGIGVNARNANNLLRELQKSLDSQNYAYGTIAFLKTAYAQINQAFNDLPNINTSGTNLEANIELSDKITKLHELQEYYIQIAQALSDLDRLAGTNLLGVTDKANIEAEAKKLIEEFKRFNDSTVMNVAKQTMENLCTYALGEKIENGIPIATIVAQMSHDSSIWDFLYSWSRVSNPVIAAMGTIVRDMQNERDLHLGDIALQIRRMHNRARSKGVKNTRFMYGDDGYIISDRDHAKFNKEKAAEWFRLKERYNDPFIIDELMEQWVQDNTEERVVDNTPGHVRTERVPNDKYAKEFPDLTEAEMEYYLDMMQLKGELGSLLPQYAQKQFLPPQLRQSFIDALSDAYRHKSFKKLLRAISIKIGNIYKIREDDINFASTGVINGEEFGIMEGGLDAEELKKVPIYYINRIKEEDQDQLLKDFSGAMQHFASSVLNYYYMNKIVNGIEFMKDYMLNTYPEAKMNDLKGADIISLRNNTIIKGLKDKEFLTPRLVQELMDAQLYGKKLHKESKWTKFWLSMLGYTSKRHLTVNLKGAIANEIVGELQMFIEAGGGQFYNTADLLWAHGMLLGEGAKAVGGAVIGQGALIDYAFNNESSMPVVLGRFFNPIDDNFDKIGRGRYHTNILRHLISEDLSFMGYGIGEHMIHYMNMYAVLKHVKVTKHNPDGTTKKVSLYSILSKTDKLDGSADLTWDKTATYVDEEGNERPVDLEFLKKIKEQIRYVNQTTHGSMSSEDKGVIHRYIAGRFLMNLRQWMVEHYSRRFRKEHWDAALRKYVKGYHRTFNAALKNTILNNGGLAAANFVLRALHQECVDFDADTAVRFGNMTPDQKAAVKRARREYVILALLSFLNMGLGDPKDYEDDWLMRMFMYQVRRALLDIKGGTPIFLPFEINTLINSPISATSTFRGMLYPFFGIPDLWADPIQRGHYEGWNRYFYKVMRYTVPYWYQIEQMRYLGEDEGLLNFDRSIV